MTVGQENRIVVVGIGNRYRRDDGFGPAVLAELARLRTARPELGCVTLAVSDGEPTRMLELWTGADLAVVVDAVRDGEDHPGHTYELSLDRLAELPERPTASSHAIGLGSTVDLARVLDRLPGRLVVLAVGGSEFGFGEGLTREVATAVRPITERVLALVGRVS